MSLDNVSTSRVFILGAGFSKPAGMPTATDLTQLLLKSASRFTGDDFRDWVGDLQERIRKYDSALGGINFEGLFDFASFDRELYLMKQQLSPVGYNVGPEPPFVDETPYQRAERISKWLRALEEELLGVLLDSQARADLHILKAFIDGLRDVDTVLTFNYDTLLETALNKTGISWSHGFEGECVNTVTVLKLHGSIDWWMYPRDKQVLKGTKLFEKRDVLRQPETSNGQGDEWEYQHILYRQNLETIRLRNERHTGVSTDDGYDGCPGIGGLGRYKPLHRLVGSGHVWFRAFRALKDVDEIYVVGWSASPFDTMASFHFSSVLKSRPFPPSRIVIVDPNAKKNKCNYDRVFGKHESIDKCLEEVDWMQFGDSRPWKK